MGTTVYGQGRNNSGSRKVLIQIKNVFGVNDPEAGRAATGPGLVLSPPQQEGRRDLWLCKEVLYQLLDRDVGMGY